MMTRPGWYVPPFELDVAMTEGESYEPTVYWALRSLWPEQGTSFVISRDVGGLWRLYVDGKRISGFRHSADRAALWAERAYLGGKPPTGERVQEVVPEESSLRIPPGVTVYTRLEPDSPCLWRDETVGEEPEEGAQRECAPDIREALLCTTYHPLLRQIVALERAATALRAVGHPSAADITAEAKALEETLPPEGRARIETADKMLRSRRLTAEEKALLRLAYFWE